MADYSFEQVSRALFFPKQCTDLELIADLLLSINRLAWQDAEVISLVLCSGYSPEEAVVASTKFSRYAKTNPRSTFNAVVRRLVDTMNKGDRHEYTGCPERQTVFGQDDPEELPGSDT